MNCGANVFEELLRLSVAGGWRYEGTGGEELKEGKDWFLEWLESGLGEELKAIDFGRPAADCWSWRMSEGEGEGEGDGDGEPLLKGLLRIEGPLRGAFVMMESKRWGTQECER